jgi:tRNA:m4X modification enzyme
LIFLYSFYLQPSRMQQVNSPQYPTSKVGGVNRQRLEWAKAFALRLLSVHQRLFSTEKQAEVSKLSLGDIENGLPLKDYSLPELQAGLGEAVESYHIRSGGPKHLQQQASLLGHLRKLLGLPGQNQETAVETQKEVDQEEPTKSNKKTIVLELGAGRGMTGLVCAGALVASGVSDVSLLMVERSGTRSKAETILRNHKSVLKNRCINVEGVRDWERIQCDLAHVDMPTVMRIHEEKSALQSTSSDKLQPSSQPSKENTSNTVVVALAKHLCGAGTDLALKALYPIKDQVGVCIMATCCHGLCSWEDYVGRDFLQQAIMKDLDENNTPFRSFGREEFELMRMWSSGTVKENSSGCLRCTPQQKDKYAKTFVCTTTGKPAWRFCGHR